MNPRRLSVVWLLCSFLVYPCFSQEASDSVNVHLQKGSWSLQFGLVASGFSFQAPLFSFEAFDGAILSAKWHVSDQSAFRASLGFVRNDLTDNFWTRTEERFPDNGGFEDIAFWRRDIVDLWMLDVSLLYLRYIPATPALAFYTGLGPGYELNLDEEFRSRSQNGRAENTSTATLNTEINDMWGAGVHFIFGAEWFVTSGLSIIAEYHSALFYREFDITSDTQSENASRIVWLRTEEAVEEFSFQAQPVRLGVSFYF